MKRVAMSMCLFSVVLTSLTASAQEPMPFAPLNSIGPEQTPAAAPPMVEPSPVPSIPGISQSQMTPEMYLYLHELKRNDDPKQAVRRKAELKTAQRMQRLAAQKWYGISNARPMASAQPFMDMYSPRWIGNSYNPMDWRGIDNSGATVLRIETQEIRR
jgi:hypothetical protein